MWNKKNQFLGRKGVNMKILGIIKDKTAPVLKKYKYAIIIMIVGLFLISFPNGKKEEAVSQQATQNEFSTERIEKKLEKSLSECLGVGRVTVTLTLSSGSENIYAEEERKSVRMQENGEISDTNEEKDVKPQMVSEGSGKESALLIKQLTPKFCGALVVCDGADDVTVRAQITEAVISLTGLSSDRISVIKMKN